jgi:hypothetical protein
MILAFMMVFVFCISAMAGEEIQMTGRNTEMNGMFGGKQSHGMRGGMNDRQPPEMNGEFNGQQPPEMNGGFNGQQPPEINGERKHPISDAIESLEDGEVKDSLLELAEAVDAAREAEMAARKAGETDLSSYEEAVKVAQEALMAALQDAGIEMQEAHMERDNRNFGGRQQPRMNNEFNGQQPPEKPEGDLQPEVPSEPNE